MKYDLNQLYRGSVELSSSSNNRIMKAVVLVAIIFASAYAEVTKEDRLRIQKVLLKLAEEQKSQETFYEQLYPGLVDGVASDLRKSGQCVDEAAIKAKDNGKLIIDNVFNQYINMFEAIADSALVLEDERMEVVKKSIDSGDLKVQLNKVAEEMWNQLNENLKQFAQIISNCQ